MADFPIRGVVTLTFFNDTLESIFASESVEFVKLWLELVARYINKWHMNLFHDIREHVHCQGTFATVFRGAL